MSKQQLASGKTFSFARFARNWNIGLVLGIVFLLLQAALVIQAQFVNTRYFCWAPHTIQAQYTLRVEIDGKILSEDDVKKRYHLKGFGWEAHSIHNVFALLEQHEETYGKKDQARLTLEYRVNGGDRHTWIWPKQ